MRTRGQNLGLWCKSIVFLSILLESSVPLHIIDASVRFVDYTSRSIGQQRLCKFALYKLTFDSTLSLVRNNERYLSLLNLDRDESPLESVRLALQCGQRVLHVGSDGLFAANPFRNPVAEVVRVSSRHSDLTWRNRLAGSGRPGH